MITDGCIIHPGVLIEHSVLSPGVVVRPGAVIRDSIILTDAIIEENAIVNRTIIDKRVNVGKESNIGFGTSGTELPVTMIGKNSVLPVGLKVHAGAVISTDIVPKDFPEGEIYGDEYIQTQRLPYEI
jgi:glucose-1-phosphate adenylyltransferase